MFLIFSTQGRKYMDKIEPDEYLLTNMPHFIAIKYHQLLNAQGPQEQVRLIVQIYDLMLRTLTVSLISQYISQFIPPERVNIFEPSLHRKLREFLYPLRYLNSRRQRRFASAFCCEALPPLAAEPRSKKPLGTTEGGKSP